MAQKRNGPTWKRKPQTQGKLNFPGKFGPQIGSGKKGREGKTLRKMPFFEKKAQGKNVKETK